MFEGNAHFAWMGVMDVQLLEAENFSTAGFHHDDFIADLLRYGFLGGVVEPHGQRPSGFIVIHFYLVHILSPSLIASVMYDVIRKPEISFSSFMTAQAHR